ncbi:GumC family protein [Erythrobacter sp. GH1-10]|uniref:GumC family protein n=1 Tax=Erythrobacter sp. GH1-10 TaxID=3349334 RepID=UPI003877D276
MFEDKIEYVPQAPTDGSAADQNATFLHYWQLAKQRRLLIVVVVGTALIAGILITLLSTPQYTATSRIEISREEKRVTNVQSVDGVDGGQNNEFYQTQYALLNARSLAERVSQELQLPTSDAFFEAHGEVPDDRRFSFFEEGRPLTAVQRQMRQRQVLELLEDHIDIAPVRGSALVDVSYSSADPVLSEQVANTWASQFIAAKMDRRFDSSVDARRFLEERLVELKSRLNESERELVNYARQKGIVILTQSARARGQVQGERTLVEADLESLNTELAEATAARIEAESRAGNVNAGNASREALESSVLARLREKRAEVAGELRRLLVQFDEGYPPAQALEAELRVLDADIAREEARIVQSRQNALREATRREGRLKQQVNELKADLGVQQSDSIRYNILLREVDTNRQLYDALLQRFKEIGVAGVGANNIAVVDTAQVPVEPSSPSLPLNLAIAFVLGLGLSAGLVLVFDQLDQSLHEPDEVARLLQLPLLGSIPIEKAEDVVEELGDPKTSLSEAYISVYTNLALASEKGVPDAFMTTSTRAAEGKSTSSFALAIMLSRTGKKVALVDADMRSASLHEFLGLSNDMGLSTFLSGNDTCENLLRKTHIEGITLLPAGPQPPNPAELLSGSRLADMVKTLLGSYDHVLIDAPPVLGLADAPLISKSVGGVIYVAEANGASVKGIRAAVQRLKDVRAPLLGVILSKVAPTGSETYGYGYGFAYGRTDETQSKS